MWYVAIYELTIILMNFKKPLERNIEIKDTSLTGTKYTQNIENIRSFYKMEVAVFSASKKKGEVILKLAIFIISN